MMHTGVKQMKVSAVSFEGEDNEMKLSDVKLCCYIISTDF